MKYRAYAVLLVLAWVLTIAAMFEDDPRWQCRTMGNQTCGHDPIFGTRSTTVDGKTYA